MIKPVRITQFKGKWQLFSNFATVDPGSVKVKLPDGELAEVLTIEHGFQAAKSKDVGEASAILAAPTPADAKRLGRAIKMTPDEVKRWDRIKQLIMLDLLQQKFAVPAYAEVLQSSLPAVLIEGNQHHDNYWGICSCAACAVSEKIRSYNFLGQMLMYIRDRQQAVKLGFSRDWATWRACVVDNSNYFEV